MKICHSSKNAILMRATFKPLPVPDSFSFKARVMLQHHRGRTVKYFSNLRKNLGPDIDGWAVSLKGMMSIVVLLGFTICGIYWWVNKFVVDDPTLPKGVSRKKKEKPKMGMTESFKFLLTSRYVKEIATLVVPYGISIILDGVTLEVKTKVIVCKSKRVFFIYGGFLYMHKNCYLHHDVVKQSYIPQVWLRSSSYRYTYCVVGNMSIFFWSHSLQ